MSLGEPGRPVGSDASRPSGMLRLAMRGLRMPNFARFFVGQSVSTLGTWSQNLATSLVVLELTGSPLVLGMVTAAGQLTLPRLPVAAAAIGVVSSVERPVGKSFLRELGPDLVPNGVAMLTVSQSVARLMGPAMLLAVRGADLVRRPTVSRAEGRLRVALRHVRSNPPLRRLLVVNAFGGLLALNFLATIDSIVYLSLEGSATMVGAAHALNAVGAELWVAG